MPTIFITGATSGIGLTTARLMHERGWAVAGTGSSEQSTAAARRTLTDDALLVAADNRSGSELRDAVALAGDRFGGLDALLLNAGSNRTAPVAGVDEALLDDLVDVNFKGPYRTLQAALPLLADGGSIVFTVGTGVTRGIRDATVATATKGALLAMMPSLVLELAPRRIRVNAVSPGAIATRLWDAVPADRRDAVAATIPLGRFGTAGEVAETVAFLCSPGAAYVTGQHIAVAGGV